MTGRKQTRKATQILETEIVVKQKPKLYPALIQRYLQSAFEELLPRMRNEHETHTIRFWMYEIKDSVQRRMDTDGITEQDIEQCNQQYRDGRGDIFNTKNYSPAIAKMLKANRCSYESAHLIPEEGDRIEFDLNESAFVRDQSGHKIAIVLLIEKGTISSGISTWEVRSSIYCSGGQLSRASTSHLIHKLRRYGYWGMHVFALVDFDASGQKIGNAIIEQVDSVGVEPDSELPDEFTVQYTQVDWIADVPPAHIQNRKYKVKGKWNAPPPLGFEIDEGLEMDVVSIDLLVEAVKRCLQNAYPTYYLKRRAHNTNEAIAEIEFNRTAYILNKLGDLIQKSNRTHSNPTRIEQLADEIDQSGHVDFEALATKSEADLVAENLFQRLQDQLLV